MSGGRLDAGGAGDRAATLLRVVGQVVADVRPGARTPPVSLQSGLERDLGLDSLAVAELLMRVEEAFGVRLGGDVLAVAETPADLLRALAAARPDGGRRRVPAHEVVAVAGDRVPPASGSLVDVLEWHASAHPDRVHLRLVAEDGEDEEVTYGDLARSGADVARGLLRQGVDPGDRVALMLPTGRDYFDAFVGVLRAGGVPVPLYPPTRPSQLEDHLRRHARLLVDAGASCMVTAPEARPVARALRSAVDTLRDVVTVADLAGQGGSEPLARPGPDDTALIQYTSGSTGQPKGVVLSHANILANIRSMGDAAAVSAADVFVSWLPLYHDMGLIGAWLGSLCLGMPAVVMSPLAFLSRPARWLWALDSYRGTLTAAPNFAYELCLRKVTDAEIDGVDLSSVRMAFNGAEPVDASTMERFAVRFAAHGLSPSALAPVYGLAESAVGLAFPPPGRGLVVDEVSREPLVRDGRATPAADGERDVVRVVACGRPLPGHEIRVVDATGREVGERREGRVQFRGPSATAGYWHNPVATRDLRRDGWWDTGDLGYVVGADLYVTGRSKDLIIRAGRNIHPEELEAALGEVPGVRKGCVAAFSSLDPVAGTERLVVVAETREADPDIRASLRRAVVAATVAAVGAPPDEVLLAPPGAVLKTSSGKIRRAATRQSYDSGRLAGRPRAVWWQLARFWLSGARPRARRARHTVAALAYAAYGWVILAAVALPLAVLLAVVPRLSWRRRLARRAARALVGLSRTPVACQGLERIPAQPCVVVANHASWLDAPLLAALLPARFTFVAGEVMGRQQPAGFILHRIGTEFVERRVRPQGVEDAARLAALAAAGRSLVLFPEGEVSRAPGLRPFHLGAFAAAAAGGRPVVPVAIRGTRSMLRAGHTFLRRGAVTVVVCDVVPPGGDDWYAAVRLARHVRAAILEHCGEPDVA